MLSSAPAPTRGVSAALRIGFAGSIGRSCFSDLLLRADPRLDPAYSSASKKCLVASLATGELDAAIYPGPPPPDLPFALLCHDRLVAAMAADHALAALPQVRVADLAASPPMLPEQGDEGEFRRVVRALLPAVTPAEDLSPRDLARRLAEGRRIGLVAAGEADELGTGLVTRALDDPRSNFEVHISWTARAAAGAFGRLLPQLDV